MVKGRDATIASRLVSLTGGVSGRGTFVALVLVYELGPRPPIIVLVVDCGRMASALSELRRNVRRLQLAGGELLVVVGMPIATGLWQRWMGLSDPRCHPTVRAPTTETAT